MNGLVEGANKILLHILKRLCSPNLGEDDYNAMNWKNIPAAWPKHFDEAIRIMNWRLLPSLKFAPKELLLGLVVNTKPTNINQSVLPVTEQDVSTQMAYVAQQRLDGYAEAVAHAIRRKSTFDKRVLAQKSGEVIFSKGQLVQVYRSDLDSTFKTERKILPKWSPPYRVITRSLNSYTLETLIGAPIDGHFSARRLRRFFPREGTELARAQKEVEERCHKEEDEREEAERMKIETERRLDRAEEEQGVVVEQEKNVGGEQQLEERNDDENEDLADEEQDEEDSGVEGEELSDDEDS